MKRLMCVGCTLVRIYGYVRQRDQNYWFALEKFQQDNGIKLVHMILHHEKKLKELDDNAPNKNGYKASKTIAAFVTYQYTTAYTQQG